MKINEVERLVGSPREISASTRRRGCSPRGETARTATGTTARRT